MTIEINGKDFAAMILSAAAAVEQNRQLVNELNVFPVPDGDTGTNMSLTLNTAAAELCKAERERLCDAAETAAGALLRGARGNSGVILSLLFRGFSKSVREYETISGPELAAALTEGVDAAYRAVMKPAEGTILTVSSRSAKRACDAATEDSGFEYVLAEALAAADEALAETVFQNPVLAKAGVIDAGGKGFCIILDGMLAALRGNPYAADGAGAGAVRESADFTAFADEDIEFAYCTEFIINRSGKNDVMKLRAFLGSLGDSLVFVDDDEIIKVHVHTNNPGKAIEEALLYGALTAIKIENMKEQHTQKVIENTETVRKIAPPSKKYGFVSLCAGDGLSGVFSDLGVDAIISGGQTMNPSTEDILCGIDAVPAEVVFVFPNNKNIIMAAEMAMPMSDKQVVLIPTKTIPQGMAAMLAFEPSADAEQNRTAMLEAVAGVTTGQITYAARQSVFDGHEICEGDHIALLNGQLLCSNEDQKEVVTRLAADMCKDSPTYITIFFGMDADEQHAENVRDIFRELCPSAEITLLPGRQPVYSYLISAE